VEPGVILAGKYRLTERIAEGGMGSVWVAHQSEPVKRKVAVKLIKPGMDSRQVLVRFEAERQALALMDHPNIAKVLDAGIHDGRPFFVMELVKGVPITKYCDEHKLTPRERLELFVPVCQAIQHAHTKGIIHRDIKPSNVLIALYDDKPVPKVIDFGVAKATGGTLTEHTIETAFNGVIGTPQYMSPEQATLNNLDIDTRSDVYSLGVLLYELLTGSPPFSRKELDEKGLLEMLRVVREEEPPRPSTKLSTANALPSLSASRGTEPKKLTGLLRYELDWIVMKALEKDRARRYETANGFAADVTRYLSGEAVQAHPPSPSYRMKKFVRRNRVQVIAAALVVAALASGLVGTTLGLVEARAKQRLADERLWEAERARAREVERTEGERLAKLDAVAQAARAETQRRAATEAEADTHAFGRFLADHVLAAARPAGLMHGLGVDVSLSAALARAELHVATVFAGRPRAEALARHEIGVTWNDLGRYADAERHLRRAVELREQTLGPTAAETRQSLERFADTLVRAGRGRDAIAAYRLLRERLREAPDRDESEVLQAEAGVAAAHRQAGQVTEAVRIYEDVLGRMTAHHGPTHLATVRTANDLGVAYRQARRATDAVRVYTDALAAAERGRDRDQFITNFIRSNLGVALIEVGRPTEALAPLRRAVAGHEKALGPDHPLTVAVLNNLVGAAEAAGKVDDAAAAFLTVLARLRPVRGPEHRAALDMLRPIADALENADRFDRAAEVYAAVAQSRRRWAADQPDELAQTLAHVGRCRLAAGQPAQAEPALRESLALREVRQPDAWTTFNTRSMLGGALAEQRKYAEAELLLRDGYEGLKAREKVVPAHLRAVRFRDAVNRLISLYTALGKPREVEKWQTERARYAVEVAPPPREKP
jgi:non-specific serine/threonine protein kinase/serine/threonine-protein kinase